jgi:hypothetical protein
MRYMCVAILYTLIAIPCGALAQSAPDALKTSASAATATSESAAKDDAKKASEQPQAVVEVKSESEQTKEEAKKGPHQPELAVVGKKKGMEAAEFRYEMGEILQIKATGAQAKKIKTASNVVLYFDGVRMTNLTSTPVEVEAVKGDLLLSFHLVRDSTNDEGRKAWDAFFKSKDGYLMTVQPAVAAGNDLPVAVQSAHPFQFFVAESHIIWLTVIAGLLILVVSYYLIVKQTKMLRDADTGYYSLGKSQMAFWGMLVLLAFIGVWLLNGTMERIPAQALVLLGISAATGLGAVVIGNSKRSAIQTEIEELRKTAQPLETEKMNALATFSQESQNRLTEIENKIADLDKQLKPGESKGFWSDICDDGNGISFHRLQVVGWTFVLGAVFVRYVAEVMSMPEFPETLLTLMGISNATYLGFKIPEK